MRRAVFPDPRVPERGIIEPTNNFVRPDKSCTEDYVEEGARRRPGFTSAVIKSVKTINVGEQRTGEICEEGHEKEEG